jgi:hypothetical protein
MAGFRKALQEQVVIMKASHDQNLATSLAIQTTTMSDSMTSLEKRLTDKITGYDAAMGKLAADAVTLNTTVTDLQNNVTQKQQETDNKFERQTHMLEEEVDKLKTLIGARGTNRTPPKTPKRPFATTFDSEILIDGIVGEDGEQLREVCQERVFSVLGVEFDPNQVE